MQIAFIFFIALVAAEKISSDDEDEEGTPPIPKTSFSCEDKIDGFYADIEAECKIYHYCQTFVHPDDDTEHKDWPFHCPPTTIFKQQHLTCSKPHKSFKCEDSEKFYDVNEKLPGTELPPAVTPESPDLPEEEEPTTTPSPPTTSSPLETEPPITTEDSEEPITSTIRPTKPDNGFLLPPLQPGEYEDKFFNLPPLIQPYLLYPSVFPSWFHLHFPQPHSLKRPEIFTQEMLQKYPFLKKDHVQTLDEYLKKTRWENIEKHLEKNKPEKVQTLDDYLKKTTWEKIGETMKKFLVPASTKLLEDKTPTFTIPKFDKQLFETSYTIKNGKLTNEPFKFKFFDINDKPTGPR